MIRVILSAALLVASPAWAGCVSAPPFEGKYPAKICDAGPPAGYIRHTISGAFWTAKNALIILPPDWFAENLSISPPQTKAAEQSKIWGDIISGGHDREIYNTVDYPSIVTDSLHGYAGYYSSPLTPSGDRPANNQPPSIPIKIVPGDQILTLPPDAQMPIECLKGPADLYPEQTYALVVCHKPEKSK